MGKIKKALKVLWLYTHTHTHTHECSYRKGGVYLLITSLFHFGAKEELGTV